MTDEQAAANKELLRRFYRQVYVDWNMALADEVLSPRFISHDWPEAGPSGPEAFRDYYAAMRSAVRCVTKHPPKCAERLSYLRAPSAAHPPKPKTTTINPEDSRYE